jgi:hypothetical protein
MERLSTQQVLDAGPMEAAVFTDDSGTARTSIRTTAIVDGAPPPVHAKGDCP